MAGTSAGQFLIDKEVQAELEKQEQLKRIGHTFIHAVYTGRNQNPRYHGFHSIGITTEYDPEIGKDIPRAILEDRVVEFRRTPDGRLTADILDDEYNRYAISRHLDLDMDIDDPALREEIAALTDKPYVVEPDRKTHLMREKARIEAELDAMSEGDNSGHRRRSRRPRAIGVLPPAPVEVAETSEEEQSSG
jgi:hypothetical protein